MKKESKPKEGDLRVWWIPQVPGKPFRIPVKNVEEGKKVMDVLADYDLFQLHNNIKPDYANAGGLVEMYEANSDGEGNPGWCEWNCLECCEDVDHCECKVKKAK